MRDSKFYKFSGRVEHLTDKVESKNTVVPNDFGLCSTCTYFSYSRTKLGTEYYGCDSHLEIKPKIHRNDPITICKCYEKSGQMTLQAMWNIATLVDVTEKKIGFDLGEKEVKFSKINEEDVVEKYD